MSEKLKLGLRIAVSILCFLIAGRLFFEESTTDRNTEILTAIGSVFAGLFFLFWEKVPPWLGWSLLAIAFVGVKNDDIYAVTTGQEHWSVFLPSMIFILLGVFMEVKRKVNST